MDLRKDILIGSLILSIFVFTVASSTLYVQTQISKGNACGCWIPLPLFIPFLGSVGLFIGIILYSLFNPIPAQTSISQQSLLNLFDKDERKVVKALLDKGGERLQAEIVKKTKLSKVKVHRILKRLEGKQLVEKKAKGNTNLIKAKGILMADLE